MNLYIYIRFRVKAYPPPWRVKLNIISNIAIGNPQNNQTCVFQLLFYFKHLSNLHLIHKKIKTCHNYHSHRFFFKYYT